MDFLINFRLLPEEEKIIEEYPIGTKNMIFKCSEHCGHPVTPALLTTSPWDYVKVKTLTGPFGISNHQNPRQMK